MNNTLLLSQFDLLATAPGGVAKLRELILTLAVQGKLVPQNPADEAASELLKRVAVKTKPDTKKVSEPREVKALAPYTLPKNWAWAQLGNIVENMGSGWSPACDEGERTDPMRWAVLRTTAVQVNEFRSSENKALPLKLTPRPEIEVKSGDILITRAGPMNRVGISCWVNNAPPRLMLSDKIVRFHSIDDEMLPAFIVLALNAGWTKVQVEQAKTGMAASQVNISQSDLRSFWLPICSRAEQARIVTRVEELMRVCDALEATGQRQAVHHRQLVQTLLATLTGADRDPDSATPTPDAWQRVAAHFDTLLDRPSAVDALEQTILQLAVRGQLVPQDPSDEPASELLKRIRAEKDRLIAEGKIKRDKPLAPIGEDEQPFELPMGWEWVRCGDYFLELCTGPFGSMIHQEDYVTGGVPLINPSHMISGRITHDPRVAISQKDAERLSAYALSAGDMVLARRGEVGRYALVTDQEDGWLCGTGSFFVRLHRACDRGYLGLVFTDGRFRQHLQGESVGSTMTNLNQRILLDALIALPPLPEQARIVARVADLRRLCADLRQRLSQSQTTQAALAEALVAVV
jgi:type I restriction enzyme S subunit